MFKMGSFEAEIVKSMAENLASNNEARKKEVVKTAQAVQSTKIDRAVDHLNSAAELFDSCGLESTAEIITTLIEKLANREEPEIIEFESLLHGKDDDEEEDEDLGEQIIEMESLLGKKKDLISDKNNALDVKTRSINEIADDKYTGYEAGLTPKEEVENLKNTGTPFNYGKHDKWTMPSVGLDNNPDKNQKFTDKDMAWED